MKPELQAFLRDVIDNATCPACGAKRKARCFGDNLPAGVPETFGTHDARVRARRAQMSDDDYARAGLEMLARYQEHSS